MKTTKMNEKRRMNNAKWMKVSLFIFSFSFFILSSSCGSDEDNTPEVNDGKVKFSSGNVAKPQQRIGGANGDQWEGNESIGIYMVANGTNNVAESAENVEYSTTSTGASASFTSLNSIYYPVNTPAKVDFIAYHPHNTSVSNYVYDIDLATQTSQSAIDLMLAKADKNGAGYDKSHNSAVNLVFDHQLVKLVLNVTAGDGISDLTGLEVKIEGMENEAKFNLTSKALSDRGTATAITPFNKSGTTTYEAILLPVATLDNTHVVKFTVGGDDYVWTMTDNTNSIIKFEVGKRYTFDVKLQKEKVEVEGTIKQWESIGGGDVTVN